MQEISPKRRPFFPRSPPKASDRGGWRKGPEAVICGSTKREGKKACCPHGERQPIVDRRSVTAHRRSTNLAFYPLPFGRGSSLAKAFAGGQPGQWPVQSVTRLLCRSAQACLDSRGNECARLRVVARKIRVSLFGVPCFLSSAHRQDASSGGRHGDDRAVESAGFRLRAY